MRLERSDGHPAVACLVEPVAGVAAREQPAWPREAVAKRRREAIGRLRERHLGVRALARTFPVDKSGQGRADCCLGAADVCDQCAGQVGWDGESAAGDVVQVVSGPVSVRGPAPDDGDVGKSRKVGMQARPAEAETLEGVRTLRSQKHVGPVEEPIELRPPCLPFEIEGHDLLASGELGVPCRRECLERVAIGGSTFVTAAPRSRRRAAESGPGRFTAIETADMP